MEIDLASKCRVCLCDEEQMHYLFNEFDQGVALQEILTSTTNFKIDQEDGFSPYLCQNCTTIVIDFYNLLTIYKENYNQVKALIDSEKRHKILVEPTENETVDISEVELESVKDDDEGVTSHDGDNYIIETECNYDSDDEDEVDIKELCKSSQMLDHQYNLTEDAAQIQNEYNNINTYTCPECRDCFVNKNDIQEHLATKHDITEIDYEELSEVALVRIKKLDHKVDKCKICSQTFPTYEAYKEHLEIHKQNVCNVCGLGFIKKSYLKDHQEIHCTEKKHVCNFCNKAFKRRTVLLKHRRLHTHPRSCTCLICGKAFNDKGTLKTHIMLVHAKERNYICLICGVKFPLKATLEKHIRRHQSKEKEFFCAQCPLGYRDKSSLDRHIFLKHSGQNIKSTCSACGKQYVTSSSLLKHQRASHGIS